MTLTAILARARGIDENSAMADLSWWEDGDPAVIIATRMAVHNGLEFQDAGLQALPSNVVGR